jgi:EAL domain-containing protein (putative c-di-GMP-specific phosphodiesterase class I)/CheY-like chemotaxis protein
MQEGIMENQGPEKATNVVTFGKRKIRPRVCVVDGKEHIRTFLVETLEELGFIPCECAHVTELGTMLDAQVPDLVLLGLSAGGIEAVEILKTLAAKTFDGKLLLLGPRACPQVAAIQELGEKLGIAMLPTLRTPFGDGDLRDSVATLLPTEEPPDSPVEVDEAVREGWLELWYQPEIDTRTLALHRAEGLIRIRHPTWGIVRTAYFIPDDGDPHFRALSEYVIGRAINDWRNFVAQQGPIEIAINLPIACFQNPESVRGLCQQIPDHPAFDGLIIEINGTEVIRNLELVKDVANQLRFHKIAISIDEVGAEWPLLAKLQDFPFVEIKVDQKFVAGCSDDRLKQTVCRRIIDLADGYGVRTVAEGIETKADFLAVREMGFDSVQGFFFARPSTAKKFARTMLGRPVMMPN